MATKFKKTRKGIFEMLKDCKPRPNAEPISLPKLFEQMYQIVKARGKRPKKITMTFPSREAAIRFLACCWEMKEKRQA